ncbi:MAG TPA: cytochrome c biogenesis protein CcsA [Thermoanaerobaculia bacterium]
MESTLLGWLAVASYAAAEVVSARALWRRQETAAHSAPLWVAAGVALQFAQLWVHGRAIEAAPYRTLAGSMSLFGWMLGISYLILFARHRERAVGPFLIPFVILFSALGLLVPESPPAGAGEGGTRGVLFAFHVNLAMLAYAAFTLSFVISVLYLVQARQIRRARSGRLFSRLPDLEQIGRMNRTSVTIGLAVLAVSVLLGMAWARQVWRHLGDAKVVWALLTLLAYAFLLWMDRRGWEGRRVALLSIAGFCLVLFSYTIVNLYFSGAHQFR